MRDAVLREMGLAPIWRLRSVDADDAGTAVDEAVEPVRAQDVVPAQALRRPLEASSPQVPRGRPASGRERPLAVPVAAPVAARSPQPVKTDPAREARIASLDWEALEAEMRACTACRLCEQRKQAVPGVGDRQADWLLVGEGPGAEEDERGEPFVGAAGRLLDAMLAAIGLERGKGVYIANAVKCRPPHNRTPQADEIAACHPYLARQIALIRPRLIVALGRPAALAVLGSELSIGAARGRVFETAGIPVVVTYHPAYLLRNPLEKAKAWEDLCFARRSMATAKTQ